MLELHKDLPSLNTIVSALLFSTSLSAGLRDSLAITNMDISLGPFPVHHLQARDIGQVSRVLRPVQPHVGHPGAPGDFFGVSRPALGRSTPAHLGRGSRQRSAGEGLGSKASCPSTLPLQCPLPARTAEGTQSRQALLQDYKYQAQLAAEPGLYI